MGRLTNDIICHVSRSQPIQGGPKNEHSFCWTLNFVKY